LSSSSTPAKSLISKNPSEALCWEGIEEQILNNDFLAYNRHSLNQLIGEWYYSKTTTVPIEIVPTAAGKFMVALARAGLLEGKKILENDDEALKLLGEVSDLDPKNSAPLLYAAIIENRRGNLLRAEELLSQAQRSQFFNSYILTISKSIFRHVRTPLDLLEANTMWSKLPIPNYIVLKNYLKAHSRKAFAYQLIGAGLDNNLVLNDIEWFALEYAIGKSLLNSIDPQNMLPTYNEVLNMKNNLNPLKIDQLYTKFQYTCDLSSLYPAVDLLQNRLADR
jgi:tetratricopeptide (TPR) repeat protein